MERIKPTRSGLFAIELLIAVGVFSLCAAICVGLFVRSEVMSQDSTDLNRAVAEARSAAECFKAVGGDLEKTAELTGGQISGDTTLFISYDQSWHKLDAGAESAFDITLTLRPEGGYTGASLSVQRYDRTEKETTGTTILFWEIAALEVAS
ncbi:MAG: hypothetical protein HFF72_03525 [Oscillospiraceae bacterium]|nr:hypothetical protein [Oscillospiraceae bacterium]